MREAITLAGEVVMPVIVVTRLRLKDPGLLDELLTQPSDAHQTRDFSAPAEAAAG